MVYFAYAKYVYLSIIKQGEKLTSIMPGAVLAEKKALRDEGLCIILRIDRLAHQDHFSGLDVTAGIHFVEIYT